MKRLAVPILLGLAVAIALAAPGTASAAACPNDLTVAGIPVTGADCVDAGGGAVEINTPQLLSGKAVQILGKMILNQPRTQMVQSSLVVPTVVTVQDSVGGFLPVIAGQVTVGSFEICDLFGSLSPFDGTVNLAVDNQTAAAGNRLSIQGSQVNCHTGPALTVGAPVIQGALNLLKLATSAAPIFKLDNSGSVALPTTFGLDDVRGGRLYGNFTASVPLPG